MSDGEDLRERDDQAAGTTPARHDYPPEKFPLTMRLVSGTTGEVVWSRTVTLDEARTLATIEIPSFANSKHWPVRAEILTSDEAAE